MPTPVGASILDLLGDGNEFHISWRDKKSTSHSPIPLTSTLSSVSSQVPSSLPEGTVEVFQSPAPILCPGGWNQDKHTSHSAGRPWFLSLWWDIWPEKQDCLTDGCSLEVSIAPATHTATVEGIRLWGQFDLIEVHLQTQVIEQHTGQLGSKTSKTIPDRLQGVVSNMSLINWP